MLEGEGIHVKELIAAVLARVPDARVQVFDQRGIEVFAPRRPAPRPEDIPARVLATMKDQQRRSDAKAHDVRQRVELAAKRAVRPAEPGETPIEPFENAQGDRFRRA